MYNLLKSLFALTILLLRFFIIFKISFILYETYQTKSQMVDEIKWYICALLLDLYLINLEKHLSSDIYMKNSDGQEVNSGNK